ncbi:MAG: alpha/beta hydrolase [Armatimonadota bacterium]|nr:alpha/beta hydrolase [Armatimonadota bacterium]
MKRCIAFGVLPALGGMLAAVTAAADPPEVLLWPEGAPGATGSEPADRPSITPWLPPPERATGAAVIVCPGGGYGHLALDHEGRQVAQWLNARGVAAFVLRYRLAPRYRYPAPLLDARRAVRLVRSRAGEWRVDPSRVGVWGFSAGGHLASTLGTHFDAGDPNAADPIERLSCRPDFLILAYPVITLTPPYAHAGSRNNLLGPNPNPALVATLCNETQVTRDTPPTFLFHTTEDPGVPAENSILFYLALRKAGVAAELHVYRKGRHGVGLAPDDPVLRTWTDRLADWMAGQGLMRPLHQPAFPRDE